MTTLIIFLSSFTPVSALFESDLCQEDPTACPAPTTCRRVPENQGSSGIKKDEYRCLRPDSTTSGPAGVFGNIVPPKSIASFGFGATGIGNFFSNLIVLIYSIATIVLILMIIWGAFDWMTSGGDKEKIAGARSKIINALIGIMLFAVAFAIIQVLGQFTGFQFFKV